MNTADMTLADLSRNAQPYPYWMLPGGTALSLFSAGFHGWNDCVHFVQRGLTCECVDVDEQRLREMQDVYPDTWEFTVSDAWEFAEKHKGIDTWNVVSVDPFLGDAAEKAWQTLYLWTALATDMVTLTVAADTHLNVPDGWTASYFPRSSRAAWMVLLNVG